MPKVKEMPDNKDVAVVESAVAFSLPKRKIKVIPIKKHNPLTLVRNSENDFLFGKSHRRYSLPVGMRGTFIDPFRSEEERNAVETALSMEKGALSVNRPEKNFWKEKYKGVILGKEEVTLDLSNPNDYISYVVLKANKNDVAASEELIGSNPGFKYAIVDLGYEDTQASSKTDQITDAAIEFSLIRNERNALADALYLLNPGTRVAPDASLEWIKSQVGNHMVKDPARFLRVLRDPSATTRVLIARAIHAKAITITGGVYRTVDRIIGVSLDAAVNYLADPANADVRSLIEAQVVAAK
jgi:hypothetical protein